MDLKLNPKSISSAGKIDRNGIKIWKNLWRWEIKFETLFVIDTTSNSPWILN
jgi:hypothetical protein